MSTQRSRAEEAQPNERRLHRAGGLSALAIGLLYLVIIGLYASVGAPPVGGEAWLQYLAGKMAIWWAIVGLSLLTNFLYVPVALSLYAALSSINRYAMLIGVAFVGLFVVLEPAVNWAAYAAMLRLSGDYAAAASEAQRAIYVAAASYPSAVIASPLALIYAIGTLSFGILVIGWVMRNGVFNKLTAYLGIATGMFGIAAVAGLSVAVILNAVAATGWLFLVGFRLYRLSQQ
jgi:hypothetical protein